MRLPSVPNEDASVLSFSTASRLWAVLLRNWEVSEMISRLAVKKKEKKLSASDDTRKDVAKESNADLTAGLLEGVTATARLYINQIKNNQ